MKPVSAEFTSAWLQDTIYPTAKIICEFGSNRFNDGQIVTASSTKPTYIGLAPNKYAETTNFWRPEDVFNDKNYNTMKWLVCDRGALLTEQEDGTGYRCIDLDSDDTYERGWWSEELSELDGTFSAPEWVQSEFYSDTFYTTQDTADHSELPTLPPGTAQDRLSVYINNVPAQEPHSPSGRRVNKFVLYLTEGYENMKSVTTQYKNEDDTWIDIAVDYELDENEYEVEWEHDEDILVYGLRVYVNETRSANDNARISEFNAYYIKDISEDIVTFTVDDTREEFERTVPIGSVSSNTFNIDLDNTEQRYNPDNIDGVYSPYLGSNNRFEVYVGVDVNADPDNPEYEYVQMGEYWSDEWAADASSAICSVSCRDFSKFLMDEQGSSKGHVWVNTNVQAVFSNLLLRKGLHISRINIDDTFLRGYQMLYIEEDSDAWQLFADVALIDQGVFGFDYLGNFNYWSYNKLQLAPFNSPQADLNWDENLINASLRTEIYANSISVSVSPINTGETGTRSIWGAEDPTILSWAKMDGAIAPDDTEIKVKEAPRQDSGNLTDNGWTDRNGYLWIPEFDEDSGLCIGGEMIKYETRSDSKFMSCKRGYLGTQAREWADDQYIGEARFWEMEFDNSPATMVKHPFVTAIDSLEEIPEEGTPQAYVIHFDHDAFKGKLAIGNIVNYYTWLAGSGQTAKDIDDVEADAPIAFATSVAGWVAVEKAGRSRVNEELDDPLAENFDLIRRYGKNALEIDSKWCQTRNHAQDIANILADEFKHPRKIVDFEALLNPALSSSDRVKVSNLPQLSILNKEYHIMNLTYTYDGGLLASGTIREVKQ